VQQESQEVAMSERMLRQFMEMVQIDSESGNESRFLEYLLGEVTAIGGHAALDDYGNLTDASIYNNRGIEMAVIGIGAQNEHSTDECIAVADMEKAVAVLVEIFRLVANET
jgi:di/tripeptidase